MKGKWILTVYFWNVWMVNLQVQAVCEDTQDCKNINCKSPGVANFCKKTCKICTAEGCKAGFYEAENGQCISCVKSRQLITDSYNRSCSPCPKGLWGLDCNTSCGVGCINNMCNKWTGKCKEGCIFCYKGDKCDHTPDSCDCKGIKCKCKNGFYGNNCLQQCHSGCKTEQNRCDQITGKCSNGCVQGYSGDKCDRNCSRNCVGGTCDQSEGNCDKGCVLGWFGTQCTLICPSNCNNNNCSRQDGKCYEGCSPGWFGDHCNLTCPINCNNTTCVQNGWCNKGCKKGWHGGQCSKGCSKNCISDTCNRTDGSCQGCNEGYKGYQCNMTCPRHCAQCDQYGDNCFVCKHGWYGLTCEKSCNSCTEGKCNITDGSCLLGCKDGFYGRFCNSNCSINCKDNSDEPLCSRESGNCTGNCTDGWYGNRCDQKCLQCKYHRCDRITGNCPLNVVEESTGRKTVVVFWVIVPCSLIIILLVVAFIGLKRKSKKTCKLERKMVTAKGGFVSALPMVNPSYLATPKDETDLSESQPLTEGDVDMSVQFRADVKKKDDPFCEPARMHPRIFSSYIPSDLMQEEAETSDHSPFPCQLPYEPQLGCVWSTEVQVENFKSYVQTLKTNLGLTDQFYYLPYGQLGPCEEGTKQMNAFKNRYRNILPYDHSRVKLHSVDGIPCSDYINANYINGYGKPKAFVATQGPYVDVLWDFWRMVWEQDSGKIVMLTNLVESRKNKCEQYWPDLGQPKINYDGVFVQCVTEKQLGEYTVRTFTVQLEEEPPRTVKQYHFTAWPDRGVPKDVTSLVEFHQTVKQSPASSYGPIIVHCSAGVGRTGTFLALDYLIAQARAEGIVDVYDCVTRLRHQRMDVIQTEEQYIFLHDALAEALPSGDRPSKEYTRTHNNKGQTSNGPAKSEHRSAEHQPEEQEKKHHKKQRLPDIPKDLFSSLLSASSDRRS